MDVLGLRVLREVAWRGSISAAAEALGYTQPAVSRQLAALERAAGHELVRRGARGTAMTPAGEVLLRRAEAVLGELEGARADLERLHDDAHAPLRLHGFQTTITSFVPAAVQALRRARPDLDVEVRVGDAPVTDVALRDDRLDVALTNASSQRFPDARVVPLRRDPLWCVLPQGHPLADVAAVPVAALRGEPMILSASTLCADRELVLGACAAAGFSPHAVARVDDMAITQGLVAAGVGVATLPEMGLGWVRDDVVLRPFATPLVREVVALLPRHGPARPEREALLDALRAAADAWCSPAADRARARAGRTATADRDDAPTPATGDAPPREAARAARERPAAAAGPAAPRGQAAGAPVRSSQALSGSPVIRS